MRVWRLSVEVCPLELVSSQQVSRAGPSARSAALSNNAAWRVGALDGRAQPRWLRNIHDTIPQRFRLHATESLGPLIIMRRVDVHKEQAVRIAGRHEFRPDFLDPQFLDGKRGLQRS